MDDFPGAFEQLVMLALARLGDSAYGMTVRREIAANTGRDISLGAVYATLDRLARKAWIASHDRPSEATAQSGDTRGGRARRFYRLLPAGTEVLERSLAATDRMRAATKLRVKQPPVRTAGAST